MKPSSDYHDYVFKNGKLVGKFDEMYKYSSEIPWHQDKSAYSFISHIDIVILKQFKYKSICEIGCGFGYFLGRLYKELNLSSDKAELTGIDISQTAVKKAKSLFPEIHFVQCDLFDEKSLPDERFDLVVIKGMLWYVCHRLTHFLQNAVALVRENGFLYVSQPFPRTERWMGQNIIGSPEELERILSRYVTRVHHCINYNNSLYKNGNLHFLGKKHREKIK